jgi:MFS family permease
VANAFTSNVLLIVSISFLGVAASMIPAIVTALPAEILGSNMSSIGFGITAMFANIGIALTQPLVGYLLDVTQSYMLCMFTMAALAVMGMVSASTLKTK